ncbi:MAG: hypothetical protein ACR2JE_15105 [Acidobacteriaceae bacterium]
MFKPFLRLLVLLVPAGALVMAGCGGSSYNSNPNNGTFTITPATTSLNTNGQIQLAATLNSGGAATVNWAILNGQNDPSVGQGSIDATGVYTPPPYLSQDSVQVKVQANLTSNIYTVATAVITVTPGFNQAIAPENATLSTGSTVQLVGVLDEFNTGTINWSLSNSAGTGTNPGSSYGSIGSTSCQRSSQFLTTCTATYTAPSSVPASAPLYVLASANGNTSTISFAKLLLNGAGINTSPLNNQASQTSTVELGASGGNNNDFDTDANGNILDCASGTLGALVADQSNNQYILSNNHVLAESDQANSGDSIIQPGLVDTGCTPLSAGVTGIRAIASLKYWVPLISNTTNVDAALATVASGAVDPQGGILSLGTAGSGSNAQLGSAPPAGGTGEPLTATNLSGGATAIQVVKSGRTTGLTCSTVDSIANTVQISYFKDVSETQPYTTKTFTNQIGIPGSYFSDFGDSGALVVDASNAEPVGLFFAGSVDNAGNGEGFAHPIADVLSELSTQSQANGALQLQVVGGGKHPVSCLNYDANTATAGAAVAVPAAATAKASAIANTAGSALVDASRGILGVATGRSIDQPGRAAVIVYVDPSKPRPAIPQTLQGLPTLVIPATPAQVASGTAPRLLALRPGIHLPQATLNAAVAVHDQYASQIMTDPAFFGVGVTQSQDDPSQAALLVFVDMTKTPRAEPATIGGLRVRYKPLHRIRITLATRRAGMAPVPAR